MVQGLCDIIALCLGLVGLIGVASVTGLPMWKVTAFIGENIIVMETRWEGLWMNCFRQANIRMQCKVYDSLLYLPADLQAARGLTCCALALSTFGLLLSLIGLRCTSCLQDQLRTKSIILIVTGVVQILACVCIIIPVSWTAHGIIRDFYNPLLLDAQRRELGEALYIGWVTGAFLFASGVLFCHRRIEPKLDMRDVRQLTNKAVMNHFQPFNSTSNQPMLQNHSVSIHQSSQSPFSFAILPSRGQNSLSLMQPMTMGSPGYNQNFISHHNPNIRGQNVLQSQHRSRSFQKRQLSKDPSVSLTTASPFYPVPQRPLFIGYQYSHVHSNSSDTSSGPGLHI